MSEAFLLRIISHWRASLRMGSRSSRILATSWMQFFTVLSEGSLSSSSSMAAMRLSMSAICSLSSLRRCMMSLSSMGCRFAFWA